MKTILLTIIGILWAISPFAQVSQVADLNPGASSSNPVPELTINGNLIFSSWNSGWSSTEIWTYDGTNTPTQLSQVYTLIPGRYVHLLNSFNGKLYFTCGNPSGGYGEGLWEYDFVNAPTKIVDSDPSDAEIDYSTIVFNNKLYFTCSDPTNGMELWSYDGTNAPALAYDLNPTGSSTPSSFTLFQSKLYFAANDGSISYLYEYDGVNTPTVITNNLYYYGYSPFPINNNKLYFTKRTDQMTFSECAYEFDGTNVTNLNLPNVGEGQGFRSQYMNSAHFGVLYFSVIEWATGQTKYWEYDFTNPPGPSNLPLHQSTSHNNEVYFYYDGDSFGKELWKYDGTTTTRLTDLNPAGDMYIVSNPYHYQNKIYFGASDEVTGAELWMYDPNFVGVNENSLNSLNIYPNPASSTLTIETEAVIESIDIFNVNGKLVQTETTNKFSVESLTDGVYFIHAQTVSGTLVTQFIKE